MRVSPRTFVVISSSFVRSSESQTAERPESHRNATREREGPPGEGLVRVNRSWSE
jgi:hypothetical protein